MGAGQQTVLQDIISPIVALPTPRFPTMHHPMITNVKTADMDQPDMTSTKRRLTTQEAEKLCSRIQALQQSQQPDPPRAGDLLSSRALNSDSPPWVSRSADGLGLGLLPSALSFGDENSPVLESVYDTQPHPTFKLTLPLVGPSSFQEVSGFSEDDDETAESFASSDDTLTGPSNITNDPPSPEEEEEEESPPQPITFLTSPIFPKRRLYNIVEVDTPPPSPPLQARGSLSLRRRPLACSSVSNKTKSLQPLLSFVNAPGHTASYTPSPVTNRC